MPPDIVCFSQLRWDFVYQRPQHVMSRFARDRRVLFFEEPITGPTLGAPSTPRVPNLSVIVPHFPPDLPASDMEATHRRLFVEALDRCDVREHVLWFFTPLPVRVPPLALASSIVYDCMDELAAFKDAPRELAQREAELLAVADVVFTGGPSLYAAKQRLHGNVLQLPSSVDAAHFLRARSRRDEPADQAKLPHPRAGYCGVIDERLDLELIATVADRRPSWQIVLLGPVVKIDPSVLPRRANIHYLGGRHYDCLPDYMAGWDVALMPFALNEATRYISPTKTLEYLAAGLGVVSSPIADVVSEFGQRGVAHIAHGPSAFIAAIEQCLATRPNLRLVDDLLGETSWDSTWATMAAALQAVCSDSDRNALDGRFSPAAP